MSIKTFKPLPIGNEDFASLREKGCYYVDKTPYLKVVFEHPAPVMLFTRPRRFGKTLLMDMFATYLAIDEDGSTGRERKEKLFAGLEVSEDATFADKYMGQFPVIFISLKKVYGDDFKHAYDMLVMMVSKLYSGYQFLKASPRLTELEKKRLFKYEDPDYLCTDEAEKYLVEGLDFLSKCLHKHYEKKVILLIDEYDVPLAKASEKGYHSQMVDLISHFFDIIKKNPNNNKEYGIEKIVLTGCLKVAKNSIFTGINNLFPNTVLSEDSKFDSIIGFTKDEIAKLLKDYNLEEYTDLVKDNYDGYRFNKKEMYCPWDVVNFIYEALESKESGSRIIPGNYWINSTSSNALLSYVGFLSDKATEKMQSLMDGKTIGTTINDSMNYDTLSKHEERDFYSLLLHTGYLTSIDYHVETINGDDEKIYTLKIPNREIRKCFEVNILNHFREVSTQGENKSLLIAKALFEGDCATARINIKHLLKGYVSVRDFATRAKPENFYHGFLSGVFSNCESFITDFKSNSETGDGYADITFLNGDTNKAVIIELKIAESTRNMKETALQAIKQIEDKNYADGFIDDIITEIYCYGISFCQKECFIEMKRLNNQDAFL